MRQPEEYAEEHLPGATLIPLPELTNRLSELDPGRPTIVYCAIGGRSARSIVQEVCGSALKTIAVGACALLIGHNHPSGDPTPSAEDLEVTRRLAELMEKLRPLAAG